MSPGTLHFAETAFASESQIDAISVLLAKVFDSKSALDWAGHLRWQYLQNPSGLAVCTNVFDSSNNLVGHYAVVPLPHFSSHHLEGSAAFLSLNTAVHRSVQGRGVFQRAALQTFSFIESKYKNAVLLGVANAQSTPGFVQKLGFTSLGPIPVKVSFKEISINHHRKLLKWDTEKLKWRFSMPSEHSHYSVGQNGIVALKRKLGLGFQVVLSNQINLVECASGILPVSKKKSFLKLYADLNLNSPDGFDLPSFLKPSPLNFIFKCIDLKMIPVVEKECRHSSFEWIDFDAF